MKAESLLLLITSKLRAFTAHRFPLIMSTRDETIVTTGVATLTGKREPSRVALGFAFLSTWVIWGSTYLAIKFAVETIPPFVTAGVRHFFAGSILFAYSYWRGFRPKPRHWVGALIVGAFYFLGGHGLLHWAERLVSSGLSAVLMATEPMIISTILIFMGKERFSLWTLLGMACGIGGVVFLVGGQGLTEHSHMLGVAALIASSISWSIGVCYSPRAGLPEDPFASAAMTMLCGSMLLLITAGVTGEFAPAQLNHITMRSVLGLLFLIVLGSVVAFSAYVWLLGHVSPTMVATHTFVNPVVAVLLGWSLAGEALSARLVVAMLAILGSIAFIRMGTKRPAH
jgi:drug/metabolite transporter (DMT)-like permease